MSGFSRTEADYRAALAGGSISLSVGGMHPSQYTHQQRERAAASLTQRLGTPPNCSWSQFLSKQNFTKTMPDELIGPGNLVTETLVIHGLKDMADNTFLTKVVAPISFMSIADFQRDGMSIIVRETHFDRYPAEEVGPLTGVRMLGYNKIERKEEIGTWGLGIFAEGGALAFLSGQETFDAQLLQIVVGFNDRLTLQIVNSLATAPQKRAELSIPMRMGLGPSIINGMDAIMEEVHWFSFFTKFEHPWPLVAQRGRTLLKAMCGEYPDVCIAAPGIRMFVQRAPENTYQGIGDRGFAQQYGTIEKNQDLMGATAAGYDLTLVESPDIPTGENSMPLNRLVNTRAVGQFFHLDYHMMRSAGKIPPNLCGVVVYDWEKRRMVLISVDAAIKSSGVWDDNGLTSFGRRIFGPSRTWADYAGPEETLRMATQIVDAYHAAGNKTSDNMFFVWSIEQPKYVNPITIDRVKRKTDAQEDGSNGSGDDAEANPEQVRGAAGRHAKRGGDGRYRSSGGRSRYRRGKTGHRYGGGGSKYRRGNTGHRYGGGGGDDDMRILYESMGISHSEIDRLLGSRDMSGDDEAREQMKSMLVAAMFNRNMAERKYAMGIGGRYADVEDMKKKVALVKAMLGSAADGKNVFVMGPVLVKMNGVVTSPGGKYFQSTGQEINEVSKAMAATMRKTHAEAMDARANEREFVSIPSRQQIARLWDRTRNAQIELDDAMRRFRQDAERASNRRSMGHHSPGMRHGHDDDDADDDEGDYDMASGSRATQAMRSSGYGDEASMEEVGQLLDAAGRETGTEDALRIKYTDMANEYMRRKFSAMQDNAAAYAITMDRYLRRVQRENLEEMRDDWRKPGIVQGGVYDGVVAIEYVAADPSMSMSMSDELRNMNTGIVAELTRDIKHMEDPATAMDAVNVATEVVRAALDLGIASGANTAASTILKHNLMNNEDGAPAAIDLAMKVWGEGAEDSVEEMPNKLRLTNFSSSNAEIVNTELRRAMKNFNAAFREHNAVSDQEASMAVLVAVELGIFYKDPLQRTPIKGLVNATNLAGSSGFANSFTDGESNTMPNGAHIGRLRVRDGQDARVRVFQGTAEMWVELQLSVTVEDERNQQMEGPSHIVITGGQGRYRSRSEPGVLSGNRNEEYYRGMVSSLTSDEREVIADGVRAFTWAESSAGVPHMVPAMYMDIIAMNKSSDANAPGGTGIMYTNFIKNMRALARLTNKEVTAQGVVGDEDDKEEAIEHGETLDYTNPQVAINVVADNNATNRAKLIITLKTLMYMNATDKSRLNFALWMAYDELEGEAPSFKQYTASTVTIDAYNKVLALFDTRFNEPAIPALAKSKKRPDKPANVNTTRSRFEAIGDMQTLLETLSVETPALLYENIAHGIVPFMSFLLLRSHMAFRTNGLTMMYTPGAMRSVLGNVSSGSDYQSQWHAYRLAVRGAIGATVLKPKQILNMNNMMINQYIAGGGAELADNNSNADMRAYRAGDGNFTKDIFVCPVPSTWKPKIDMLDITGTFDNVVHELIGRHADDDGMQLYPNAKLMRERWGFEKGDDPLMCSYHEILQMDCNVGNGSNSRMMRGPSLHYDNKGTFNSPGCRVGGNSHLGTHIYPDKRACLEGKMDVMRETAKTCSIANMSIERI